MLNNLGRPTESWDDLIVHIIVCKLPKHSRHLWETDLADNTDPATWEQLEKFLRCRFRTLEASSGLLPAQSRSTGTSSKPVRTKQNLHLQNGELKCVICGESNSIFSCTSFTTQSIASRRQLVREKNLCYNCLRPNHSADLCNTKRRCQKCQRKHHTLLHQTTQQSNETPVSTSHATISPQTPTQVNQLSKYAPQPAYAQQCTAFPPIMP